MERDWTRVCVEVGRIIGRGNELVRIGVGGNRDGRERSRSRSRSRGRVRSWAAA